MMLSEWGWRSPFKKCACCEKHEEDSTKENATE
jgi:hypothetical protein